MFHFKMKSDTIQFIVMMIGAFTLLGSMIGWASNHFATVDQLDAISNRVSVETEERRELKHEVDTLYQYLIPTSKQQPIRYPGSKR